MNVLGRVLDAHEASSAPRKSDAELLVWLNKGEAPEVRLLKFDAWVGRQLAERLEWGWAGEGKARRIEQYRVHLERIVLDLWRRGWMLDGEKLAAHITGVLDRIGNYQRAGKVVELWPYYKATVDRYVGANAEELKAEAMKVGAHAGQLLAALGIGKAPAGPSIPELVAQRADEVTKAKDSTLRAKLQRQRAKKAADEAQGTLL